MDVLRTISTVAAGVGLTVLLTGGALRADGGASVDSFSARAFFVESESAERRMEEGRSLIVRMRMGEAERVFNALARTPDGAVAAYHHLALSSLIKALVADEQRHYKEFFRRSDSLQEALSRAPAGAWRSYVEAENSLQVMAAHVKQGNFLRAALAARKAYAASEEAVKKDPAFYDAYKTLGVVHLAVGTLPSTQRRILQVLGYPGDVERGLRELRLVAERGRYGREEAAVILGFTEGLLLDRPEQGISILREVYERTGKGPLIGFTYGFLLLKARRAADAERVLRAAAQHDASKGYVFVNYVDHHLADALFKQDDFAGAERHYRRYVERHKGPSLKAASNLEIGRALEMQGKRAQALPFYAAVKSNRPFDTDQAAVREAARRLAAPMSAIDRTFLLASNAFGRGSYARVEALMQPLLSGKQLSPDQRAEAAYRLGRSYHVQEKWAPALAAYGEAAASARDGGSRWKAWALYFNGQVHAAQGQRQRAEQSFLAALAVEGKYDFYQSLEASAKAALARTRS